MTIVTPCVILLLSQDQLRSWQPRDAIMDTKTKKTGQDKMNEILAMAEAVKQLQPIVEQYADNIKAVQSSIAYDDGLKAALVALVNSGLPKSIISNVTNISSGLIGRWIEDANK